jgi:hypothetical protein
LNSEKINPDFLIELQTKFALNNKKWGLIRGVKGSRSKNVPLKKFYKVIDSLMATNYKKQIDAMIGDIHLSIGERVNIDTIRNKIRDHIAPYLNSVALLENALKEFGKLDFHKLQEELIQDQKKLKSALAKVDARRGVYREAINDASARSKENQHLMAENEQLKIELAELKQKYEPVLSHLDEQKTGGRKIQSLKLTPKNL